MMNRDYEKVAKAYYADPARNREEVKSLPEKLPKAPKGFLGTLADLLKASPAGGAPRRPQGAVRGRTGGQRQPKKPCGGCGGK